MSELTKKLHILKDGEAEEETVTLYSTADECAEPNLKFEIDGALAYAKLGDVTDANATSLRIYRDSDSTTYAVLKGATALVNYWIDIDGAEHIVDASDVVTISSTQFNKDESIYSVNFPSCKEIASATYGGGYNPHENGGAFGFCTALTSVELPAATSIGDYAFKNCTALTSVDLPAATSIGEYAFCLCTSLTTAEAPLAVSIGENAFYHCRSLTTINFPMATSIGGLAFDSTGVTTVELPAATTLGDNAFAWCTALTKIYLPSVISFDTSPFVGCTALLEIHFAAANEETLKALDTYSQLSDAPNATVYFDL